MENASYLVRVSYVNINGNFVVNGSVTLDGTVDDSNVFFESQDISNLIVHNETTMNTLITFSSIEIDGSGQFKPEISVAVLSSLSDVSCYYLDLNNGLHVVGLSEMNNVSINEHANIKDVSCDYLEVKSGAWLTGPISYKYGEEDYVYSLSPLE
jgi:cytoskeletal protein CcmA (bactofilin family)